MVVCNMPLCKGLICAAVEIRHRRSTDAGHRHKKMAPKIGAIRRNCVRDDQLRPKTRHHKVKFWRPQSPKYGRSPLRTATSALAMSRRSMAATRRARRLLERAEWMEAVSDMWFPFLRAAD